MYVELINPSDAVTFDCTDVRVAGVAVLLLGGGAYGLKDAKGDVVVPLMLFGGDAPWLKEQGIDEPLAWLNQNLVRVAGFLETVCYGDITDRVSFDEAVKRMTPKKAAEYRDWWNDRRRSSMNNIGRGALKLAKQLRDRANGAQVGDLVSSPPIILAG